MDCFIRYTHLFVLTQYIKNTFQKPPHLECHIVIGTSQMPNRFCVNYQRKRVRSRISLNSGQALKTMPVVRRLITPTLFKIPPLSKQTLLLHFHF